MQELSALLFSLKIILRKFHDLTSWSMPAISDNVVSLISLKISLRKLDDVIRSTPGTCWQLQSLIKRIECRHARFVYLIICIWLCELRQHFPWLHWDKKNYMCYVFRQVIITQANQSTCVPAEVPAIKRVFRKTAGDLKFSKFFANNFNGPSVFSILAVYISMEISFIWNNWLIRKKIQHPRT